MINEKEKRDKKGTYITLLMLIMMALLFFVIGHGYAAKQQVVDCNSYIQQEIIPNCIGLYAQHNQNTITPGGKEYEEDKTGFNNYNFT